MFLKIFSFRKGQAAFDISFNKGQANILENIFSNIMDRPMFWKKKI